jgi:hypothetical protein
MSTGDGALFKIEQPQAAAYYMERICLFSVLCSLFLFPILYSLFFATPCLSVPSYHAHLRICLNLARKIPNLRARKALSARFPPVRTELFRWSLP